MFKKGQLVRITERGRLAVISFAHHKECSVYFAESLTASYLTVLYAQDGNNFKFKWAK